MAVQLLAASTTRRGPCLLNGLAWTFVCWRKWRADLLKRAGLACLQRQEEPCLQGQEELSEDVKAALFCSSTVKHSFIVQNVCVYMPNSLQEELSEDVKVALAAALAAWLPRSGGMPEPALARIAGGRAVQHEAGVLQACACMRMPFRACIRLCDCKGAVRPRVAALKSPKTRALLHWPCRRLAEREGGTPPCAPARAGRHAPLQPRGTGSGRPAGGAAGQAGAGGLRQGGRSGGPHGEGRCWLRGCHMLLLRATCAPLSPDGRQLALAVVLCIY